MRVEYPLSSTVSTSASKGRSADSGKSHNLSEKSESTTKFDIRHKNTSLMDICQRTGHLPKPRKLAKARRPGIIFEIRTQIPVSHIGELCSFALESDTVHYSLTMVVFGWL